MPDRNNPSAKVRIDGSTFNRSCEVEVVEIENYNLHCEGSYEDTVISLSARDGNRRSQISNFMNIVFSKSQGMEIYLRN